MARKSSTGLLKLPRDKGKFSMCLRIPLQAARRLDYISRRTGKTRSLCITEMIMKEPN